MANEWKIDLWTDLKHILTLESKPFDDSFDSSVSLSKCFWIVFGILQSALSEIVIFPQKSGKW